MRMKPSHIRAAKAMEGATSEAIRKGGPEFQEVATNQPTSGTVPIATAAACHLDRDAATKPTAPSSAIDHSPTDTARS
jgi:hypothetical protein